MNNLSIAPPPKAVLFDLDGTLIDSAPDLGSAADLLRTSRGLPSLPLSDYRPMAGAGARGMLQVAFGIAPDHRDFESLKAEFFTNYEAALTYKTRAFDAIEQLLSELQNRGLRWGVVTNKAKRFTDPIARQMPILHGASTVVSGDTTPHAKPHPAPLLEAARQLGLQPNQCWYVGDDRRDIIAGQAAGMYSIAATWGYLGEHAVDSWRANAQVAAPLQILELLGQCLNS